MDHRDLAKDPKADLTFEGLDNYCRTNLEHQRDW